ncbi:hypothetical protein L1049_012377 [Liquidambar formosana]|uniref:Uncharacterized protein n=1 Tax=Liquidambar formosana TaxID=63359 RepID=A0AAP0N306_LIQFO
MISKDFPIENRSHKKFRGYVRREIQLLATTKLKRSEQVKNSKEKVDGSNMKEGLNVLIGIRAFIIQRKPSHFVARHQITKLLCCVVFKIKGDGFARYKHHEC